MLRKSIGPAVIIALLPATVHATDLVFSVGRSDFLFDTADDDYTLGAEVHFDRFATWRGAAFSLAAATNVYDSGTYWIGAGVSVVRPFGDGWFVEASIMPGFFKPIQDGQDLGSNLEFRSLLGVGRRISDRLSLSLAVSHKSNAGTAPENPGVNLVHLRLRYNLG